MGKWVFFICVLGFPAYNAELVVMNFDTEINGTLDMVINYRLAFYCMKLKVGKLGSSFVGEIPQIKANVHDSDFQGIFMFHSVTDRHLTAISPGKWRCGRTWSMRLLVIAYSLWSWRHPNSGNMLAGRAFHFLAVHIRNDEPKQHVDGATAHL